MREIKDLIELHKTQIVRLERINDAILKPLPSEYGRRKELYRNH